MRRFYPLLLAAIGTLGLVSSVGAAERNDVVVSIKPLHSLVSAVMQGVGRPKLIVQGTGSEHGYSLKPSDAEAIANAKIIFWAGPSMETFLEKPISTLGSDASVVALGDTDGLTKLRFREGGPFEIHEHEEHAHSDAQYEEHDHAKFDLHFWLDPENGRILVEHIAQLLSAQDPVHAEQYQENAAAYGKKLDALTEKIAAELEPFKGKPFIVFHDAYQYFENRFAVQAVGSITVSPEKTPGAARIRQIHNKVKSLGAVCVFSEPQFEPKLVNTVIDGTAAKTGVLDPLGADLPAGPYLYPQLISNLATSLRACLG